MSKRNNKSKNTGFDHDPLCSLGEEKSQWAGEENRKLNSFVYWSSQWMVLLKAFFLKPGSLSSWATFSQLHKDKDCLSFLFLLQKVPQTYWLVATYIYSKYYKISLPVPKSSCLQGCFLLEGLRALVSLLFLSLWWQLAFLGFWTLIPSLTHLLPSSHCLLSDGTLMIPPGPPRSSRIIPPP